jgi:BASS family bile acid:Na+ symporter
MSLAELIPLLLKASIIGMVFSIGLRASIADATTTFRHPANLLKGTAAMFLVMPLVAVALIKGLNPLAPTGIILVATALSPVPPILPNKELKAGVGMGRAVGSLVASSVVALLLIPVGMPLIGSWFGLDLAVPLGPAVSLVMATILVPLAAGVLLKTLAPGLADKLAPTMGKASAVILLLALVPVLIQLGPAMWAQVGGLTVLAFLLFAVIGVGVGHWMAGDDPDAKTVLAISTASRHPALAAALATAARPEAEGILPAAVLYLLISVVVTGIYLALRRKGGDAAELSPA